MPKARLSIGGRPPTPALNFLARKPLLSSFASMGSKRLLLVALWLGFFHCTLAGVPAGISCLRVTVSPPSGPIPAFQFLNVTLDFNQPVSLRQAGNWYNSSSFPGSTSLLQVMNALNAAMIVMSNGTQRNPIAASFLGPSKIGIDFNWADVPPANRLSLRLTENFATDDVYRAAMPPMSLTSYTTPGGPSQNFPVPEYDNFCPQRPFLEAPVLVAPPALSNGPSSVALLSADNLSVSISTAQLDSTLLVDTVQAPNGDIYRLLSPLNISVAADLPSGILHLDQRPSLTPNYEQLQTLTTPSSAQWKETSRVTIQTYLDAFAAGGPSLTILTGGANRPYQSGDSLDAAYIETLSDTGVTTDYRSEIRFQDGTRIQMAYEKFSPRPTRRWFVVWPAEASGFSCSGAAPRNSWTPEFPTTYHAFGTVLTAPWSQFVISSASWDSGISVLVNGSSRPLSIQSSSTMASVWDDLLPSLLGHRVVMPDVAVFNSATNYSEWLLLPERAFYNGSGSTCNTLDVTMYDFVHQSGSACTQSLGTCLQNQLGSFISNPSYRLAQRITSPYLAGLDGSTGSMLPRIRLDSQKVRFDFNGRADLTASQLTFNLTELGNGLQQPAIGPLSWTLMSQESTYSSVSLEVTNTGELGADFELRVSCVGSAITPIPTQSAWIDAHSSTRFNVTLSLQIFSSDIGSVSCDATVTTAEKPLWRSQDKSRSPATLTLPLESNGCFSNDTHDSFLFAPLASWEQAIRAGQLDSSHWVSEGGLLGVDPLQLNQSNSWLLESGFSFYESISMSFTTHGTSSSTIFLEARCADVDGRAVLVATPPMQFSIGPNATLHQDLGIHVIGRSTAVSTNCTMRVTLSSSACSMSTGKFIEQPFRLDVPAFPCSASEYRTEPSLFLAPQQWAQLATSPVPSPRDMMPISLMMPWTARPNTLSEWLALGFTEEQASTSTSFGHVSTFDVGVTNAGNATGLAFVSATCSDSIQFSYALSSSNCSANPSGTCFMRLAFLTNKSSSDPTFSCVLMAGFLPPSDNSDVCWSSYGKVYLQEAQLDAVVPPLSGTPSPSTASSRGLFGLSKAAGGAVLAAIITVGIVAIVAAIATLKYWRRSEPVEDMEVAAVPTYPNGRPVKTSQEALLGPEDAALRQSVPTEIVSPFASGAQAGYVL